MCMCVRAQASWCHGGCQVFLVERGVLLVDDRVGHVELEALEAHDLLLERVARDEAVDGDDALLA
eukprot:3253339-Pleurochrysis_carterae.AAC.2